MVKFKTALCIHFVKTRLHHRQGIFNLNITNMYVCMSWMTALEKSPIGEMRDILDACNMRQRTNSRAILNNLQTQVTFNERSQSSAMFWNLMNDRSCKRYHCCIEIYFHHYTGLVTLWMINVCWNKNINIKYQCWDSTNECQHEMCGPRLKWFIFIRKQNNIPRQRKWLLQCGLDIIFILFVLFL